jgi:hypothetical protein
MVALIETNSSLTCFFLTVNYETKTQDTSLCHEKENKASQIFQNGLDGHSFFIYGIRLCDGVCGWHGQLIAILPIESIQVNAPDFVFCIGHAIDLEANLMSRHHFHTRI